jgi:septal ring factor EnvC (AmiA/AmiB activator)
MDTTETLKELLKLAHESLDSKDKQIAELGLKACTLDLTKGHLTQCEAALESRDELNETLNAKIAELEKELIELKDERLPNEQGTNRYGLDVAYFRKTINRELNRDLRGFMPSELARVLARLSVTADKQVIHEPEFSEAHNLEQHDKGVDSAIAELTICYRVALDEHKDIEDAEVLEGLIDRLQALKSQS